MPTNNQILDQKKYIARLSLRLDRMNRKHPSIPQLQQELLNATMRLVELVNDRNGKS